MLKSAENPKSGMFSKRTPQYRDLELVSPLIRYEAIHILVTLFVGRNTSGSALHLSETDDDIRILADGFS